MPGHTELTISVKTLWQSIRSKFKAFLNQHAEKICWKVLYGWMEKYPKKQRKYYWSMECSLSTQIQPLSKISACCRCSLPSWLLLRCNCKMQACWSSATVTTMITTILVWCNRQQRWLDIAIKGTNSCPVQVYQTCMLVGASLTDMSAD